MVALYCFMFLGPTLVDSELFLLLFWLVWMQQCPSALSWLRCLRGGAVVPAFLPAAALTQPLQKKELRKWWKDIKAVKQKSVRQADAGVRWILWNLRGVNLNEHWKVLIALVLILIFHDIAIVLLLPYFPTLDSELLRCYSIISFLTIIILIKWKLQKSSI